MMPESYKDRWQRFFEQAEDELGDTSFNALAARADELLADDEVTRIDAAHEHYRDIP